MLRKKVIVRNTYGLQVRPATKIAKACLGMDGKITICKGFKNANGRSVFELLLLAAEDREAD